MYYKLFSKSWICNTFSNEGLNFLTSLPAATIAAFLQSTPANADEANMKLEDFAKLIEMEGMVDKQLPSNQRISNG
jgi:hypothetical protein